MVYEFKLPDIGEGLVEGEVTKWHVKEGDTVTENQPLVNVLTDKAEVEIPSPKSGKIAKLLAKEGQKVKVHSVFVTIEVGGNGGTAKAAPAKEAPQPKAAVPQPAPPAARTEVEKKASAPAPSGFVNKNVLATPLVRKLAAQRGIDLSTLRGTGPAGRITEKDLEAQPAQGASRPTAAKPQPAPPAAAAEPTGPVTQGPLGPEERIPFLGIRRRTAEKMAQSAHTVAAVTHVDDCDFTALVQLREELKPEAARKNLKLTFLPFIIKALVKALQEFPGFNASLDEQGGAIVRKRYYNIGIAVSAPTGLLVPNIKKADEKDIWVLAESVGRLAEKVRSGKIEVPELQGGTFTITNIGPIGGLFATPIVNVPEVAILGIMKMEKRPVVRDGGIHIRDMANLCLSFDHRVNDGAEAAQFMKTIIKHLENPRTLI